MSTSRSALVTGGGVRVGRAIVLALAKAGYDVAIHCHRSIEDAHGLQSTVQQGKRRAFVFESDLTLPKEPVKLVEAALESLGRLDLLVNNAALFFDDNASMVELAQMKRLNVDAPSACIKAVLPALEAVGGSVVNIGDAAWQVPIKGYKAYSRTKTTLVELTRQTALRLASSGVRINTVCPGIVLPASSVDQNMLKNIVDLVPMGQMGDAQDVADAVVYLAGASYVTGQVLAVDGGRSLVSRDDNSSETVH